jgi:hypothetical protein
VPITTPNGLAVRSAICCVPGDFTDDWPALLAVLFDEDMRAVPRLLARPGASPTALIEPIPTRPVRCAGGPVGLLNLDAVRAHGYRDALARYRAWSTADPADRPGPVQQALLDAGEEAFLTHQALHRLVGDAVIIVGGPPLYPADTSPLARLEFLHVANELLQALPADHVVIAVTV